LISQDRHALEPWDHFFEKLELLCGLLWVKARYAGNVSTRPLQAWYDTVCDRIDHDCENNGDVGGRFFGSPSCHGTGHDKNVDFETDQFGKKLGKALIVPLRESRLEDEVLALDVAEVDKTFSECVEEGQRAPLGREKPNACDFGRLRLGKP